MTVKVMQEEFKLGVDKILSLNAPGFTAEEIDTLLNNAQEEFIEQRAYRTNPKGTGLEEDQKRRDDLRALIKNYSTTAFSNTANNKPNGKFIALPVDYRHSIQEEVTINYIDCNKDTRSKVVTVTPVTHDRYNKIVNDPFNKPYEDEVIRLDYEGNVFELITDGTYSLTKYFLRYLKEPRRIQYGTQYVIPTTDVDSELASHTHRELVSAAVTSALENIESNRYPTKKRENITVE